MRRAKAKPQVEKRRQARRRRPGLEALKKRRRKSRARRKALWRQALIEGLSQATKPAQPNRVSSYASREEEEAERQRLVAAFIERVRPLLAEVLRTLAGIEDPRDPKKIKHQLAMVLFYGILCFVFQMASRREANRELSGPVLLEHLRQYFPELEKLPHQDTLHRLLAKIEVEKIQDLHLQMIRRLIRNKKFNRFLIKDHYPVAIDGTQKLVSQELLSPEWQERTLNRGTEAEKTQYYVYVLEASLAFANGMTLPLLSEFLDYQQGDTERDKQDCETRAFRRLAARLRAEFPRLPILLLLDGLYPNGPVFETCRKNHWQFMIVLQDKSLPTVWSEFEGLSRLEPNNRATRTWGGRRQVFRWANDIEHYWGDNGRKHQKVHVVECQESWEEIDPKTGEKVAQRSRHVWISSEPLHQNNLHERCNLAARHRWNIEEGFLTEKRQGYQYEHCFSQTWPAMKGYHYLMHLGHALNVLAQYSEALIDVVRRMGVRPFIKFIRDSLVHPWLNPAKLKESLRPTAQLRLA